MSEVSPAIDFARLGPPAGTRLAVVGGAGGMGRRLVAVARAQGLEVAALDLERSLTDHPPPEGVRALAIDGTDEASIETAFDALRGEWGGVDALVHLAGFTLSATPVTDLDAARWDEVMAVNLRSAYLAAKHAVPAMRTAGQGAIVAVASNLATLVEPGMAPYSASKAGMIALVKALAKENAPAIRANCVAPSAVDTAFLRGGTGRGGDESDANILNEMMHKGGILESIPLGRIAGVDDVIGPILFLLGPAARYMTGQTLYVNGGRLMP